ncbi:hypothetical protein [Burkholderia glumae]|uniref:hypothetical protein n=1 Tax=Burkholderia glumae TaxID=337 RepID=UPI0020368555|nr:hypothetical protein [Burkholderia glumae]MCM2547994.1 hypothetical protein [Burkholderia glumae]
MQAAQGVAAVVRGGLLDLVQCVDQLAHRVGLVVGNLLEHRVEGQWLDRQQGGGHRDLRAAVGISAEASRVPGTVGRARRGCARRRGGCAAAARATGRPGL